MEGSFPLAKLYASAQAAAANEKLHHAYTQGFNRCPTAAKLEGQ